ncbi:MAG: 23S rRNA (uracil(1939)-C(5))-methyltransferase RlmD [Lachnospiraceae bacterium]|nr:23S rRNA (uracil(1939)-C(5))-methyltransferase RlmD [Lachnospiraceae bacterium]
MQEYRKNTILTMEIEDLGIDGEGIGHVEGFTFFVKDALPGDVIEAKVLKAKKHYAYARLEKVITPSPFRMEPKCPVHRSCGGCQIQALSYEKQLELKDRKVYGNLRRIGGFSEELLNSVWEPIIGMETPWHYRNKAQYPVGTDREGHLIAGFYAGHSHNIIPAKECTIGSESSNALLEIVLGWMNRHHVPAYDEQTGKGLLRHILLREGFYTGEIMVCLVINGREVPASEDLIRVLTAYEERSERGFTKRVTSICYSPNTSDTNVIMGNSYEAIYGKGYITDLIGDIRFRISPLSFFQVNPFQTRRLYEKALEYAALTGRETVWDLYCGIGTISLFLARKAALVCGVEIIPQAIDNARVNATLNGIENAMFYVGAAEEVLPAFYEGKLPAPGSEATDAEATGRTLKNDTSVNRSNGSGSSDLLHPDVIVVDPPRKGCDAACIRTMLEMHPDRIVYVSCDSATLARDLALLTEGGYRLRKVCPVDMFPHTVHVETVALLSKLSEAKHHIEVKVDMDELDLTSAEAKATYKEIQDWVQEKYGFHVSNLNIAQVKQIHGIIERENYNKAKSADSKQPECPEEKVKAIEDAMRHFQMID